MIMGRKNGGWSGKANFKYEIERYKRVSDGIRFEVDAEQVKTAGDLTEDPTVWEYELIELKVTGSAYYEPGKYYGPPEDSYPDDGGCEIEDVEGPDGKDWMDRLTKSEVASVEARVTERCQEGGDVDPDDAYDSRYDQDCDDRYTDASFDY
jgi:hypothetical protein